MELRLDTSFRMTATMYGLSFEDYLTQCGMTEETYQEELASAVEYYVKQFLVVEAVAKNENIEVTDEEYQAELEQYITNYGVETEEELAETFLQTFKADIKEIILEAILSDKVMTYLGEVATEV